MCFKVFSTSVRSLLLYKYQCICNNPTITFNARRLSANVRPSIRPNVSAKSNFKVLKTQGNEQKTDIQNIRNIGIMAHIDAGKTTTTERMLFYSGYTTSLGDVDDGDTVMDYMEQERNRGITITAAAISFSWNKHRINLIDTPGHVDFTLEVERALRVLDGAVTILDASAGVEAQTLTVWRQADKYNIPRIVFLNKMDKHAASFHTSIQSLKEKLNVTPLVTQIPIGQGKDFTGIIDVITMEKILWDMKSEGMKYVKVKLDKTKDGPFYLDALKARTNIVEQLADIDEKIGDYVLNDTPILEIKENDIYNAVRAATLKHKAVPLLCGSSLKNKGVQPLLDAVTLYLPSPNQRKHEFIEYYDNYLCALAFKIVHDKQKGALTFLRLYNGTIEAGSSIYNVNRDCTEKTSKLLQVYADDYKEVPLVSSGNIIAVSGLKQTITGDTLVTNAKAANQAKIKYQRNRESTEDTNEENITPVLANVEVPEPVFFCSIEPPSQAYQVKLEHALDCLVKEDPSLRVSTDDTGQMILSGMGELHLEIIRDRIHKEYKVDADLGPLQIAYKETLTKSVEETFVLDQSIGDRRHSVTVCLSVLPSDEPEQKCIELVPHQDVDFRKLRRKVLKAVNDGMTSGKLRGPILGNPVINLRVQLHDIRIGRGTSLPIVTAAVAQCMAQALKKADAVLLQPIMDMEITTDEHLVGAVLGDLGRRRSQILEVEPRQNTRVITAKTPLSELMGYSTTIRTITSGTAAVSLQLAEYEIMSEEQQQRVIYIATGGPVYR